MDSAQTEELKTWLSPCDEFMRNAFNRICSPNIFVDFSKAFDIVNKEALGNILRKKGCPDHFLRFVSALHIGIKESVSSREISEQFLVGNRVKHCFRFFFPWSCHIPSLIPPKGVWYRVALWKTCPMKGNLTSFGISGHGPRHTDRELGTSPSKQI